VGATPTLPPNQQPPPTSHHRRSQRPGPDAERDLVPGVDIDPTPAGDPERDGELAREEAAVRLHHELTEVDPTVRPAEEPEPLGRRLPVPLTGREGVER
jgi:hypothetical protein